MAKQWGEIDCPQCKKPMRAEALKCPYCLTEFTTIEAGERKRQNDNDNRNVLQGCFIFIVIAVVIFLITRSCSGDEKAKPVNESKTATVVKLTNWDKAAVLKDLEICKIADRVVEYQLKTEGQIAAYQAAINAKNECTRFIQSNSNHPFECQTAAAAGFQYYTTMAEIIDTLELSPSKVTEVKYAKRIFTMAFSKCETALDQHRVLTP